MSTRGFFGFVIDSTDKIIYNHHDSYPGGLGNHVLEWLKTVDLTAAAGQVRALQLIDGDKPITDEDTKRFARFTKVRNATCDGGPSDWYDLLYLTHGDVAMTLEAGMAEDAKDFPRDSLFAEWGYMVDFDSQTLEIYKGFQRSPHGHGRFSARPGVSRDYYPVARIGAWPISALPYELVESEEATT